MPSPPRAPTAPMSPIAAPDSLRPRAAASSAVMPPASAFAWKIAGIILYVEPLPTPLSTNSTVKPSTNTGSDSGQRGRHHHECRRAPSP